MSGVLLSDLLQLIFLLLFIASTPFHNLLEVLYQRVTLERLSWKITQPGAVHILRNM